MNNRALAVDMVEREIEEFRERKGRDKRERLWERERKVEMSCENKVWGRRSLAGGRTASRQTSGEMETS